MMYAQCGNTNPHASHYYKRDGLDYMCFGENPQVSRMADFAEVLGQPLDPWQRALLDQVMVKDFA